MDTRIEQFVMAYGVERDNCGCFFRVEAGDTLRHAETVTANKEFCDCEFAWTFRPGDSQNLQRSHL
jgi:hypothetical protein